MNTWKHFQRIVGIITSNRSVNGLLCKTNLKQPVCLLSTTTLEHTNNSIGDLKKHWSEQFEKARIPEPNESIEHIIAHVIGTSKISDLIDKNDKILDENQLKNLESLCQCRLSRMPVQYIIGEWDFRDITLKLIPPVFIPRPETEILVDICLKLISSKNSEHYNILEIGCGSGAISLSLTKSCEKIKCIAVDTSMDACYLTLINAKLLNLLEKIIVVNATLKEDGKLHIDSSLNVKPNPDFNIANQFDFIISNPPYVPTKEIFKLPPEIKLFEDIKALDGGPDGLKVIKPIINYASVALKTGGHILLEVDPSQVDCIKSFTENH